MDAYTTLEVKVSAFLELKPFDCRVFCVISVQHTEDTQVNIMICDTKFVVLKL